MQRSKPTPESELIASLGWKDGKMEVRYTDGAIFVYSNISEGLYRALKRASSPGSTWLKIRDNYPYKRIK